MFGDNSLEHLVAADIRKLMPSISKIRAQMLKHFGYEGSCATCDIGFNGIVVARDKSARGKCSAMAHERYAVRKGVYLGHVQLVLADL